MNIETSTSLVSTQQYRQDHAVPVPYDCCLHCAAWTPIFCTHHPQITAVAVTAIVTILSSIFTYALIKLIKSGASEKLGGATLTLARVLYY